VRRLDITLKRLALLATAKDLSGGLFADALLEIVRRLQQPSEYLVDQCIDIRLELGPL
jgi:hypothetical protein